MLFLLRCENELREQAQFCVDAFSVSKQGRTRGEYWIFSSRFFPDLEKIPLFWGVCAKQENASDFGANKFTGWKNKNHYKSNCYGRKSCFRSAHKFTPEVYTLADRIRDCETERFSLFCPALESDQERRFFPSGRILPVGENREKTEIR